MLRFFRREQLHIDLQLVVVATFIALWVATEKTGPKNCGWRFASACSACGADYEFECSGSCSLLMQNATPEPTAQSCCGAVVLSSDLLSMKSSQGNGLRDRLGAYKMIGTECGGRAAYQHYSEYLFYQNESTQPGWRVSKELCGRSSLIRQKDSLDRSCPEYVANWEYLNGDDWELGEDLSAECAQRAPPNSTCTEPNSAGPPAAWLVWIGALIGAAALSCGVRALCAYARRRRQMLAHDFDSPHSSTAPEKHFSLVIAVASLTFILVYFVQNRRTEEARKREPKETHPSILAMQWGCTLVLAIQLGWLFHWHDTLLKLRRQRRSCAYALCVISLLVWYLAIPLLTAIINTVVIDGIDSEWTGGYILLIVLFLIFLLIPIACCACLNRLKLRHLASLDDRLAEKLASGAIRLLDAEVLRSGALERIERRQDFDALETAGEHLFVQPEEAVRMLKARRRQIGFLTYGWRTSDHPDPDDKTLQAVVSALRSEEGAHITAVFWDCPCLWQGPRTPDQNAEFKQGLEVMADGYASPLGVTVLRRKLIPPLPEAMTGRVVLFGVDASLAEQRIRAALIGWGRTLTELWFELDRAPPGDETPRQTGRWHARFASHEQAAEAVDELQELPEGANGACLWYNERAYTDRGWCVFESFVSMEALIRIEAHPRLKSHLRSMKLPPKLLEIDGDRPVPVQLELNETVKERVERMRLALTTAAFTGRADRAIVVKMLETYIDKITAAIYLSGEGGAAQYRGEYNSSGNREGHGILRSAEGRYEGGFVAGKKHGRGVFVRNDNKWTYEGEWVEDLMHGRGVFVRNDTNWTLEGEWIGGKKNGPFICTWICNEAVATPGPIRKIEACRYHDDQQYGISVICTETLEGRSMRRQWDLPFWLQFLPSSPFACCLRVLPSSCPDAIAAAICIPIDMGLRLILFAFLVSRLVLGVPIGGAVVAVLNRCCATVSDERGRDIARRIGATMPEDVGGVELVVEAGS